MVPSLPFQRLRRPPPPCTGVFGLTRVASGNAGRSRGGGTGAPRPDAPPGTPLVPDGLAVTIEGPLGSGTLIAVSGPFGHGTLITVVAPPGIGTLITTFGRRGAGTLITVIGALGGGPVTS